VVREDPLRKGLLFAGTEGSVYVSFNDGDDWQPLQLNLPHTSMRDLNIHGDDLIVATHGRSFWILDDFAPLRQLNDSVAKSAAYFFDPQKAIRFRWNRNPDTPLPPEFPPEKPARRRDFRLLSRYRRERSGHTGNLRQSESRRPPFFQHR